MLNIIQNTIGAIRRVGESVVRAGLKMWLPFTSAEPLGENLVVNGDFSDASTGWESSGSNWTFSNNSAIYVGDGSASELLQNINFVGGKLYKIVIDIASISGTLKVRFNNDQANKVTFNTVGENIIYITTSGTGLINNDISISRESGVVNSVINSVSVEECAQKTPDISGNENDAILKTGKALQFDGNDSVETSFSSTTPIRTIAFWIKPTHSSTNETLFYGGGAFGNTRQIYLDHLKVESINGNMIMNTYVNGQHEGITFTGTPATLTQDEWQRVVLLSSETSPIFLYSDDFDIGSGLYGSDGRFIISDLQIYDKVWSADDIAYDYANPQKLVTDNTSGSISLSRLKGYWAFTEGAGGIAYDSSGGTAYNGTISGATYVNEQERILQLGMISWAKSTPVSDEVVLPYNPNNVTQDILGNAVRVKGNAFNLDGIGFAEVRDDNTLDIAENGAFTFMGWLKFKFVDTGSGLNVVYSNGGLSTDTGTFSINTNNSNKVIAYVSGTYTEALDSSFNKTDGDWVFFAITRNAGSDIKFYLNKVDTDGVEKPMLARTRSNNSSLTNANVKYIGRDSGTTRFYKERIDDLILYNTELSLDDITQNFNATKSGHNN